MNIVTPTIKNLIDIWLKEDIGRGDLTQSAIKNKIVCAHWISKTNGFFCGGSLVESIYKTLDKSVQVTLHKPDGARISSDEKIVELRGPVFALLAGERTALNIAMHLSGIVTATNKLVLELKGTKVRLADTRKTTPGLRDLEKYAVKCGGGVNHRLGLDDAAMLKENHIAWGNGIPEAIENLRKNIPWTTKIIVEAETKEQAIEAVLAGVDGVLLDEMQPYEVLALTTQLRGLDKGSSKTVIIEASGISPQDIKQYASTGVDIISTSAPITQSKWMDFSMRFTEKSTC